VITGFKAERYGCLRRVELELTPVHALIGPNDSGKSTLLRALGAVATLASRPAEWSRVAPPGTREPDRSSAVLTASTGAGWYRAHFGPSLEERVGVGDDPIAGWSRGWGKARPAVDPAKTEPIVSLIGPSLLARFDPEALREGSQLIPESQAIHFLDGRGRGLPGIYQAIQGRGDEAFANISSAVRQLFPTVKRLRVVAASNTELAIETELLDGTRVSARDMSEGLLFYLAFAALPHVAPVKMLLIEEPENGLHPARIRDVLAMLRAFVEDTGTQVVMATHSPLVVNELKPDEVTLITRTPDEGTRATAITRTHNFDKRSEVYALGELWVSYADGKLETPLVDGTDA